MSLLFDSIELDDIFFLAKFDPSSYKRFIKQYHICLSFVEIKRISLTGGIITYDIQINARIFNIHNEVILTEFRSAHSLYNLIIFTLDGAIHVYFFPKIT